MRRVLVGRFAILAVFALAASALAALAVTGAEDRFRQAGAAYEAGRWEEATTAYEALLAEGFDDPRVHYNLGNALFKQGRLGPAILEYERALARHPSDADAKENLAYANLLTVDKVGPAEEGLPEKVVSRLRQGVRA